MRACTKFIIVMGIALAACTPQPAVLPTLIPSLEGPTEVPTEAPAAQPVERATLPPEWTAAPQVTDTPVPTSTPEIPPTVFVETGPIIPAEIPGCENFGVDLTQTKRTYVRGEDVTVFWTTIDGAAFYKVMLLNNRAEEIFVVYVDTNSYVFTADKFEPGEFYGWQVHPVSPLGVQMCLTEGAELLPEF